MDKLPDYFSTRASVRIFDAERHIDKSSVTELCRIAAQAPNTGNMQLYTAIVTAEPTAKTRLAELHFNQPAAVNADLIVTVCADTSRFKQWCKARKAESGFENFGGSLTAFTDAVIYAQQLVTVAEMSGLGTCYLGTVVYNAPAIKELLGLPDGVFPVAAIAMGYPAAGCKAAASDRLPLGAVVHFEQYHKPSDAEIDTYYAEKEAQPDAARFIAENKLETLAQVYSTVRYPRATNEALGVEMLRLMTPDIEPAD